MNYKDISMDLRDKLNSLHQQLEASPFHLTYNLNSVGSILNAYREGDISFDDAIKLLQLKGASP